MRYRSSKSPGKSPAGTQRYSVISDVSSNTTSGIVSDRMATSFEEGEGTYLGIICFGCGFLLLFCFACICIFGIFCHLAEIYSLSKKAIQDACLVERIPYIRAVKTFLHSQNNICNYALRDAS